MPPLTSIQRSLLENVPILDGPSLALPVKGALTHLQFRRFSGCPICNLHLQGLIRRQAELAAAGVQEVVVFHSSAEALRRHHASAPFPLVPDPERTLYRSFGVETSIRSVLHPGSWASALKGILRNGVRLPARGESPLGCPADFLLSPEGIVLKSQYGAHADDQWSVDDVIALACTHSEPKP